VLKLWFLNCRGGSIFLVDIGGLGGGGHDWTTDWWDGGGTTRVMGDITPGNLGWTWAVGVGGAAR
jgi:hypothetical protein